MNAWFGQPRPALVTVAVLCVAAVAAALVSQYQFGMLPCPWCTLQRLIFLVVAVLALTAAALPSITLRRTLAAAGALFALSGIASALWQQLVAAASPSCHLTLADRILGDLGLLDLAPAVFEPQVSCADAAVSVLGVPYAYWSAALFALCAVVCLRVATRRR